MVEKATKYGITPDRIHLDPCLLALATANESFLNFIEEISAIRNLFPDIHITSGLSNISFGLPGRAQVNRTFMALAIQAGMDSAVMDPTNKDMMRTIFATYAPLEQDRNCRSYSKAFRVGIIDPNKKKACQVIPKLM